MNQENNVLKKKLNGFVEKRCAEGKDFRDFKSSLLLSHSNKHDKLSNSRDGYLSYNDCRCICSTQEFCSRTQRVSDGNICPDQKLVHKPDKMER